MLNILARIKIIKRRKAPKVCWGVMAVATIAFVIANIFMYTHKVYYRYNDVWIKGKNLEQVEERYGGLTRSA